MNFLIDSHMFLLHITAFTIELKLSSNNNKSELSLAISVPSIPIPIPTSALDKAGASFVPSPVTATINPFPYNPVTRAYLSSGLLLAKISSVGTISSNAFLFFNTSALYGLYECTHYYV